MVCRGRACDTPNHKDFQEECKLGTFTGKFEFVSESMLYWAPSDEIRTPIASYKDAWEGHTTLLADKYPYGMISPHPRFDYHTHYQQHAVWLWEIPENRVIINGNPYLICRINPKTAEKKGIKDGDVVRLFNDRGSVLCVARVTRRVYPETIHVHLLRYIQPRKLRRIHERRQGRQHQRAHAGQAHGRLYPRHGPQLLQH